MKSQVALRYTYSVAVPGIANRKIGRVMISDQQETLQKLRRGIAGDSRALAELWESHQERLQRLVRLRMDRRIQGRVGASDVLQEAFVDFASRAEEYLNEPRLPFFLWLRYLTGQRLQLLHRHHLGAQMRDASREVSIDHTVMPQASSATLAAQLVGRFTSVTRAVQRAELQVKLQQAIDGMQEMDREILALRHFEELSNIETAEVLGIDPSAASTRYVRALKRLREILESIPGFFSNGADPKE